MKKEKKEMKEMNESANVKNTETDKENKAVNEEKEDEAKTVDTVGVADVEYDPPPLDTEVKDEEWDPNRFEPEDVKAESDGDGKTVAVDGTETFHEDLERLKDDNHAAYVVLLVLFLAVMFPLVFLVSIPLRAIVHGISETIRVLKDDYSTLIDQLAFGRLLDGGRLR